VTDDVYRVTFAALGKAELIALSADVIERIQPKIRDLANDPRPPRLQKGCAGQGICGEFAPATIAWSTLSMTLPKQSM
jgi:hypothetical protein